MTAITTTAVNQCAIGGHVRVTASSTSVPDGYTWDTLLSGVDQVFVSGFDGTTATGGKYSWSAVKGVVTFAVSGTTLANVSLMAIGRY